ncbi:MAG TPA: hypothetical protein VLK34_08800 [Nocardioidaceae bacterium]|nr:hypothetical protein [Nocardioidaceae bacterium]
MALLHHADLRPSKLELMAAWLPGQPWFEAGSNGLQSLGAYRFDDPDGEVGIETHILRIEVDRTLQVPLTYRAAPLGGAEAWLAGTLMHSVLGRRWVYDACADPVYATALAATIFRGGTEAEEYFEDDGRRESRVSTVSVMGSGSPNDADQPPVVELTCSTRETVTVIAASGLELSLHRVIDASTSAVDGSDTLMGTWAGAAVPVLLATARRT